MNLTPWFGCHVKPTRRGVYEREDVFPEDKSAPSTLYAYWDGSQWSVPEWTIDAAFLLRDSVALIPRKWRGIQK